MKKSRLLGAVCASLFSVTSVNAAVVFYTDKASFDAATTTTTIDFEGIVGDTGFTTSLSQVLSGVTFTTNTLPPGTSSPNNATICGKDACSGFPHDSALFVADQGRTMIIDLTTAGSGFTAVGGIFGDIDGAGNTGHFNVSGGGGQTVPVADMGAGDSRTFFGWTSTGGGDITRIEFFLAPDAFFAAVDDFQFGTVNAIPIPPALWLFGSGLLGLIGIARRKT